MQDKIRQKCNEVRDLLLEKNKSYGNSVFNKGILFEVEPMYAIQARINDKLNRIKSKNTYLSENDLMDLTGYFILLQVLRDEMDRKKKATEDEPSPREDWKDIILREQEESPTRYTYEWTINDSEDETGA
jgi:hypothetical protein